MRKTWGKRTKRKVGVRKAKKIEVRAEKNGGDDNKQRNEHSTDMEDSSYDWLSGRLPPAGPDSIWRCPAAECTKQRHKSFQSNLQAPSHRAALQLCIKADNCNYY